jgi:predicted AAA+ superfamily ATPase
MFTRSLAKHLLKLATQFPVVTVTGPRQSGKTTLVKNLFPDKPYVNLEELDLRQLARTDPKAFLSFYQNGAIIDEVQYAPELFSYIQVRVDDKDIPGEFILTGSQNFLMMEKITQSLAGRVGIVELLPLSYLEISSSVDETIELYDLILQGFYPRLYKSKIDSAVFYKTYIQTYVERDLRQIKNIENLDVFQRFMKLCAARTGQLFNLAAVAAECGIAQNTAKNWLSILKTSYIIFTLPPYFKNFNKRTVKQQKLYFYDTGLVCSLLDIHKITPLHPLKGPLFENFVVIELVKYRWNELKRHNLYFWRDSHGHEVDLIFEQADNLRSIEIKANQTMSHDFYKELKYFQQISGCQEGCVIYGGAENLPKNAVSWRNMHSVLL